MGFDLGLGLDLGGVENWMMRFGLMLSKGGEGESGERGRWWRKKERERGSCQKKLKRTQPDSLSLGFQTLIYGHIALH